MLWLSRTKEIHLNFQRNKEINSLRMSNKRDLEIVPPQKYLSPQPQFSPLISRLEFYFLFFSRVLTTVNFMVMIKKKSNMENIFRTREFFRAWGVKKGLLLLTACCCSLEFNSCANLYLWGLHPTVIVTVIMLFLCPIASSYKMDNDTLRGWWTRNNKNKYCLSFFNEKIIFKFYWISLKGVWNYKFS